MHRSAGPRNDPERICWYLDVWRPGGFLWIGDRGLVHCTTIKWVKVSESVSLVSQQLHEFIQKLEKLTWTLNT